jgi:hypothetical protein
MIYESDTYIVMKSIVGAVDFAKPDLGWRLEGKVNLLGQGLKVDTKDIDIVTTEEGYDFFRSTLDKGSFFYVIEEGIIIKIPRYHYMTCKAHGVLVDIGYYDDPELAMMDKIQKIEWEGLRLNVTPLICARIFYEKMGRPDSVRLIDDYLKAQKIL